MGVDAVFSRFPTLDTNRLRLRQVQSSDADALFAIKSHPEVTPRYGQEPHPSLDNTTRWIQRLQSDYKRHQVVFWCITLKGQDTPVGSCVLWNLDLNSRCAELGYELHPVYFRQGIMSEALAAVLGFGFTEFGLHRVEACPLAGNVPSKNLLLKLGFTYEGSLRQRHLFRDHYEDLLYFGMLQDEWYNAIKTP